MSYDASIEERVDEAIAGWGADTAKKKMFGGVAWMVQGNLAFGILGSELIVRAPEDRTEHYMKRPGVHEFVFGKARGHSMKNIFMAGGDNLEDPAFTELLETGRDYALSLPPK